MRNFDYYNPVKILFGKGKIAEIAKWIPKGMKVMMTYGGGSIKKNGVYEQVMDALQGFDIVEFGGIEPNPKYETLMRAVELAKRENVGLTGRNLLLLQLVSRGMNLGTSWQKAHG